VRLKEVVCLIEPDEVWSTVHVPPHRKEGWEGRERNGVVERLDGEGEQEECLPLIKSPPYLKFK